MSGAFSDPALETRPASSFIGFWAALADVTAKRRTGFAEAEAALAEGEASIERGVESIARFIANSRIAAEQGEKVPWDYAIERLAFYESEAARDLTQLRKLADRMLVSAGGIEPSARRRARTLARRQEDAVVQFVEALRDARWQAMAFQARFNATSRNGPVFDSAPELRRHLVNT